MKILGVTDEDMLNYKDISMFIAFPYCTGKCWKELGLDPSICQNNQLRDEKVIGISAEELIERYDRSELSKAVVFGGLEPMDSFNDICEFIFKFRENHPNDKIVIYSGYTEEELNYKIGALKAYKNIVIKVGRYIPNKKSRYDDLLGVTLASDNQYAIDIEK